MGRFSCERDLQFALLAARVPDRMMGAVTYFRREVPVGECIPDLIYVKFDSIPKNIWPVRMTFLHAWILGLLRHRRTLSVETIAALAFDEPRKIGRCVADLLMAGSLEETCTDVVHLSSDYRGISAEVIALEAKLSNWWEALEQAVRYKRFADQCLVVIGKCAARNVTDMLSAFASQGIGLAQLHGKVIDWLAEPECNTPQSWAEREYLISLAATGRHTPWLVRYARNADSHEAT